MKSEEDGDEEEEEEECEISTYVKSKKLDNRISDLPEDLDILHELSECSINENNIEGLTSLDVDGMDYSLGIVDNWQELSGVGSSFLTNQTTNDNGMPLVARDVRFLELNDLNEPLINIPTDVVDQLLSLLEEGHNGLGEHFDTS